MRHLQQQNLLALAHRQYSTNTLISYTIATNSKMARRHDDQELNTAVPTDFNRIYVGSLDYFAKPTDVEELLVRVNLNSFQKIHISIDPISGRNPGYCFVDFPSHQEAAYALEALAGQSILGRVVKLGPCVPKGPGRSSRGDQSSAEF